MYLDAQQNLRDISGLKVYIIALVWSGVTVILPLVNNEVGFSEDVIVSVLQVFIFVIALMLPFEIIDLRYDSLKLATIPQKIGVKRTKLLGLVLLLIFYLSEFFKDTIQTDYLITQLIVCLVLGIFILFANQNRTKYYTSFWLEALPVFWLVLMLV